MKRQKNDQASMVYAYGVGRIESGLQAALAENERCLALWDRLVEIDRIAERETLDAVRAHSTDAAAVLDELRALAIRLDELFESRAAKRKVSRSRERTEEDPEIERLIARRNELRQALYAAIRMWRSEIPEQVMAIEIARREHVKRARQSSALHWGNYNRVLDDYDRARNMARKSGRKLRPSDPKRDDACLTVQIQRTASGLGCAPSELTNGCVAQLQFGPETHQTIAEMRINEAGDTIRFRVFVHRPLPQSCRVKRAQLVRRDRKWKLCLTITYPKPEIKHASPHVCGLDFGWRKENDGTLRIGMLSDSDGKEERLVLPKAWVDDMDTAEWMQGQCSEEIEGSKEHRRWWLGFTGKRRHLLRQRRELYRRMAHELAQRYRLIAADDTGLMRLAQDKALPEAVRGRRVRAALYEFKRELNHQATKLGVEILWLDGPSTLLCHACGKQTEQRDRAELIWYCHHCGVKWDQDRNAARNLLVYALGRAGENASGPVVNPSGPSENNILRERSKPGKRSARKEPSQLAS